MMTLAMAPSRQRKAEGSTRGHLRLPDCDLGTVGSGIHEAEKTDVDAARQMLRHPPVHSAQPDQFTHGRPLLRRQRNPVKRYP
jgi:hypothetical protein